MGLFLETEHFLSPLFFLKVFQVLTSSRCPVIGRGPTMRAPAPAVEVQMQTSATPPLQSLKSQKKENLPPSRRRTPNSPAKPPPSCPLVLKGNVPSRDFSTLSACLPNGAATLCWVFTSVASSSKMFAPVLLVLG